LLHQKAGICGGLSVRIKIKAMQKQQVLSAAQGVFDSIEGFVDIGGSLYGKPLLIVCGIDVSIRMHDTL
jgi:hypothetical protein